MGNCCKKKKVETLLDIDNDKNKNSQIIPHSQEETKPNIKLTMNDFSVLKLLGRGSFGEVLLVRLKLNQKLYAMKVLNKSLLKARSQEVHTKAERDLMVQINCPFIVDIKFAFQNETKLYLVQEFMQGGDLFFHLHSAGRFNTTQTRFYIAELVMALDFLHKNNMIYRDLKPENVLIDSGGHIKITDFGLSKLLNEDGKAFTVCGTPQYLAPEVLGDEGYDECIDWWSLGCLMYEMNLGRAPYKFPKDGRIKTSIYNKQVKYPSSMNKDAADLISKLLVIDPKKRLGYGKNGGSAVKQHPFFKSINWDNAWNKKLSPPFVPSLENETDLKYFEKTFTDEPVDSNPASSLYSKSLAGSYDYKGFSYVTGSVNNELMMMKRGGNDGGEDSEGDEENENRVEINEDLDF